MTNSEDNEKLPESPVEEPPLPDGDREGQESATGKEIVVSEVMYRGVPVGSGFAATLRDGAHDQVHSESFWRMTSLYADEKEKERVRLQADLKEMTGDRDGWRDKYNELALQHAALKVRGESIGNLSTIQGLLYVAGGVLLSPLIVALVTADATRTPAMWLLAGTGVVALVAAVKLRKLGPKGDE